MNALEIDGISWGKALCLALGLSISGVFGNTSVKAQESAEPQPAESQSDAAQPDQPQALSVPPLNEAFYPDSRPEWMEQAPEFNKSVDVWPVKSLLRPTAEEASESLAFQVQGAVAAYAEHVINDARAAALSSHPEFEIDLAKLPAGDRYVGTATIGTETVYEEGAILRFDDAFRQKLQVAWREQAIQGRLQALGVAGGAGFLLLLAGTGIARRVARKHTPSV